MASIEPLDTLLTIHRERREQIRGRLEEFAAVPPSAYFYELTYCLLTPQSSAVNADAVVTELRAGRFLERGFDAEPLLRDPKHYIRFHRVKARRLQEARERFPGTMQLLSAAVDPVDLRAALVDQVKGFGLKEATHFMRNIGRSGGLAILDRHILRNLKRFGAVRSLPTTITPKRYRAIERRFGRFAERVGIPIDELDLVFWSMETGEVRK